MNSWCWSSLDFLPLVKSPIMEYRSPMGCSKVGQEGNMMMGTCPIHIGAAPPGRIFTGGWSCWLKFRWAPESVGDEFLPLSLSLFFFLTFIDLAQWTWDRSPSLGDFTQKIKKNKSLWVWLGLGETWNVVARLAWKRNSGWACASLGPEEGSRLGFL